MNTQRRSATLCGTAVTLLLGLVGAATPASAFAPVTSPVRAAGPTSFAQERPVFAALTRCSNEFTGQVILDRGSGNGGEISIDHASFANCDSGVVVTPHALPWTLTLDSSRQITVRNVDIEIATPRGTCRYAGDLVNGFYDNTLGLYNIGGELNRLSAHCGLGGSLGVDTGFQELILVNGTGMTL